jgi:hypothetical protein
MRCGIDYPSNTVPNKVAQLFQAQLFHDRKQRWTRATAAANGEKLGQAVDYLRPLVADADTGHGGEFVEAGAWEEQTDVRSGCRFDGCDEVDENDGGGWSCGGAY